MSGFVLAPLILLCAPIYAPDPGHEDPEIHTEFHAIVDKDWKGAVTSNETVVRMLKVYPEARTFRASTWSEFTTLWDAGCTEYHDHAGEEVGPMPASKAPSPRPLGLLPTEDARMRESRLCQVPTQDGTDTARTSDRGTGDLVSRVLGAEPSQLADRFDTLSIRNDSSPPIYQGSLLGTFNSHAHVRPQQLSSQVCSTYSAVNDWTCGEMVERSFNAPMLYAVSGHNRMFRSKDRAVAVLKSTPDADLAFSCDEDELFQFLEEYRTM
ncbi:hypothetical protein C8R45DRAFT_1109285 [Mycena sanguinolenta]|nr:hypothetical protein C8R45DRAFT_1109285 [Mycena sanguinolenta]